MATRPRKTRGSHRPAASASSAAAAFTPDALSVAARHLEVGGEWVASFAVVGYRIARRAPDLFGYLLAVGMTNLIVVSALLHMGVALALLPTTGVLASACNPDSLLPPSAGLAGADEVITTTGPSLAEDDYDDEERARS